MSRPTSNTLKTVLLTGLAVVAAALIVPLWTSGPVRAQDAGGLATGRYLAVAGRVTGESYGIYLIDTHSGSMAVYQYLASRKTLRLLAARNVNYDLQLDALNTEPAPREIQELVQQHRRLGETPPER